MLCIGHRGAKGHAPENTVLSVQKALELGSHCIEVDVYQVDGHLIVFHDDKLERTTNGHGPLDSSFDYLRSLDAGEGQRIPTLQEIMETVNLKAGVNIELKGPDLAKPIFDFITKLRSQGWPDSLILISSFNHHELALVRKLDKKVKIGILIKSSPENEISFAHNINAYSINVSITVINKSLVERAHANNLRVFVYTVNHSGDIIRLKNLGVDGVFTDYPEKVVKMEDSKKIEIGWI